MVFLISLLFMNKGAICSTCECNVKPKIDVLTFHYALL